MERCNATPGTEVTTSYRWPMNHAHPDCWQPPHRGVVLAYNDPAAWKDTLAFPGHVPSQEAVDAHLVHLDNHGIGTDDCSKVPVRYTWTGTHETGICWEPIESLVPYTQGLADWEAAREAKYDQIVRFD